MANLIETALAANEFLFTMFTASCGPTDSAYLKWISPEFAQIIRDSAVGITADMERMVTSMRKLNITSIAPVDLYVEGQGRL